MLLRSESSGMLEFRCVDELRIFEFEGCSLKLTPKDDCAEALSMNVSDIFRVLLI